MTKAAHSTQLQEETVRLFGNNCILTVLQTLFYGTRQHVSQQSIIASTDN